MSHHKPAGDYGRCVTCRDEILDVLPAVIEPDGTFTVASVVAALRARGSRYAEGTIRTHVVSRMCSDATDHHARTYDDLTRVQRGRYQLRRASS